MPHHSPTTPLTAQEGELVQQALASLRRRAGRDFSGFRDNVMLRHVLNRTALSGKASIEAYLLWLDQDPAEPQALIRDLLVSVTSFFRDPEAFQALSRHLPALFAGKGPQDFVRVWVPACASGEEAYSIAMLLLEHAATLAAPPGIQVFGSDLDRAAIDKARAGLYPGKLTAPVGAGRLARFFQREKGGDRVRHELRRLVLFAEHDVIRDPAFSNIDLVSCRNLLIYLSRAGQARALAVFEAVLNPNGLLFLGTAESLASFRSAFHALDSRQQIYRRDAAQELQTIAQELHAASEELEANRQELRSMNAELSVLNGELSSTQHELEQVNIDFNNLMNAAAIPMVFLDQDLNIIRYTPNALALFRLQPSDKGRALSDLRNSLDYPELTADAARILDGSKVIEREVRDHAGRWYVVRILPYHVAQNRVGGVVLTFFDITERRQSALALLESEEKIRKAIENRSTFEMEQDMVRIDGSWGWVFSRAIPLFDEQGNIVKWFGAASEIIRT